MTTVLASVDLFEDFTDDEITDEVHRRGLNTTDLAGVPTQDMMDELRGRGIETDVRAVTLDHWLKILELLRQNNTHEVLTLVRRHAQNATGRVL